MYMTHAQSRIDIDISVENTPAHSPAVLGWRAKEVKVPDFRSSNNGKFPANAPLCPGRGGGGERGFTLTSKYTLIADIQECLLEQSSSAPATRPLLSFVTNHVASWQDW